MKVSFVKAHANGNDFIILSNLNMNLSKLLPDFVPSLCNRKTGIGADGLLHVQTKTNLNRYFIDYYNSDGSWETFCMNGLRCVAKYLFYKDGKHKTLYLIAGDGEHRAIMDNNGIVHISLIPPKYIKKNIFVENVIGHHINTGAQHFIVQKNNINHNIALSLGEKIRFSKIFDPIGINVNFFKIIKNRLTIYTYEKGVEDVMLSCASGSSAVVFHLAQKKIIKSPCKSYSLGGELNFSFDNLWKDAWVSGNSTILFKSNISLKSIIPYKL
tara:strand:+ start:710 stop:1519 length:810 start_codon:yes stop_codon:yes gene_type:complete